MNDDRERELLAKLIAALLKATPEKRAGAYGLLIVLLAKGMPKGSTLPPSN
jgi:hypothetical protein